MTHAALHLGSLPLPCPHRSPLQTGTTALRSAKQARPAVVIKFNVKRSSRPRPKPASARKAKGHTHMHRPRPHPRPRQPKAALHLAAVLLLALAAAGTVRAIPSSKPRPGATTGPAAPAAPAAAAPAAPAGSKAPQHGLPRIPVMGFLNAAFQHHGWSPGRKFWSRGVSIQCSHPSLPRTRSTFCHVVHHTHRRLR